MTKEQKRMEIAAKCGWTWDDCFAQVAKPGGRLQGRGYTSFIEMLPNFPEDLDAMHEAEKGLTINQSRTYLLNLQKVSRGSISDAEDWMQCMVVIHATADQRADAFLLTHGFTI